MLVDYCVKMKADAILRGMRALSDFEFEFQMALMNRRLNRNIETVFLMTSMDWIFTSSTIIKEAARFGGNVVDLVPPMVCRRLKEKILNGWDTVWIFGNSTYLPRWWSWKSFSKAGESAHLSQPTVSSHMKDLEDHFGAGSSTGCPRRRFPPRRENCFTSMPATRGASRRGRNGHDGFSGKVQGRLTIGGSTIPAVYILPKLIGAFTNARPGVTLALVVKDTGQIIEEVLAGTLELGIVGALSSDKKISQKKLIEDEMCLASRRASLASVESVSMDMLFQEPFIVRESGSGTLRSFERHLIENGFCIDELRIAAEMGSTEAVIQGIKNHVGISILSAHRRGRGVKIRCFMRLAH